MQYSHIPVLLSEVLENLAIFPGGRYIDCTFGGGGHSKAIAEKDGLVLGLDADEDAIKNWEKQNVNEKRIKVVRSNFDQIDIVAQNEGFVPSHGVLFDLGVSSFQLDTSEKGFSFLREGPLDMRMDQRLGISAGKLLDVLDEDSLTSLFIKFSDELHSRKIAAAIVNKRGGKVGTQYWENRTTTDLADLIEKTIGRHERIHPATRVFQALRMAVNDELGSLERGLRLAFDVLDHKGKLLVISFHSVEDRVVKQFYTDMESEQKAVVLSHIITPSEQEILSNARSRSAKMRVLEKN